MRVIFIIPYFGILPNYFDLWLKSCEYNPNFNWLIITDDKREFNYPKNVSVIYKSFSEVKIYIEGKFDFKICLERPHKLCDYKPAYGYIFNDLINDYDFWGYCDLDCIFGNLSKYITKEMLEKYDKIFSLGHMTLYRNNKYINSLFMKTINNRLRYREVFSTNWGCAFDEKRSESINDIFIENNISFYKDLFCADIDPYYSNFMLSEYDIENDKFVLDKKIQNLFYWKNGVLNSLYMDKNKLLKEEYAYIHLQKRKMKKVISNIDDLNSFGIIPGKFIELEDKIDIKEVKKYGYKKKLNIQFLKTKYSSLKYRLNMVKLNKVNSEQ